MVGGQCKSGFSINLCGIATICGGLSVLKGCRGLSFIILRVDKV